MIKKDITQYKNFHEYFEAIADVYGDSPCLTDGERPEIIFSYKQLNQKVNQAVQLLSDAGITKGTRFAALMRNCPEFFIVYLASMKMGALVIPLVADLPLNEVVNAVRKYEIKVIIADIERNDVANEAHNLTKDILNKVFSTSDFLSIISNISDRNYNFDNIKLEDPGSLYFSSGTTGTPKGIPQSPINLLTAADALAKAYGFSKDDTQMGILPVYHTALATYGFWPNICAGSNFVLFNRFSKNNFWKHIQKHEIAFTEVVPTILTMLLNPPEDISKYNLTKLKFIGCGSATLPVELQSRFEKTFRVLVANQYGLSETAPTHYNPPEKNLRKEGSIGKTLSMCRAKIFNDKDEEVPIGEIGEIVIQGGNVISNYYGTEEEDEVAFRNGWFHTGDIGYADSDGFFYLVDRKKDIVIRGGAKIFPSEVDNVLLSHPSIAEAVSFGIPDKIYGEELIACVVTRSNCLTREEEIIAHCKKCLPEYKCPKRIYIVDKIPYTASGKVLRRKLAEEYGSMEAKNEIKR